MADYPIQAEPSPLDPGHYMKLGRIFTKCFAEKSSTMEMITQRSWKKTNPILAKVLLWTPHSEQTLHMIPQQQAPAQQSASPAQQANAPHILIIFINYYYIFRNRI